MKDFFNKEKLSLTSSGFQDVIILVGIFILISILIIGLFPDKNSEVIIQKDFFVWAVMIIPVIAGIYFIIISFNRHLNFGNAEITSSIRKKVMAAFIFVAILPSLPIVLTSNYLLNQNFSKFISTKTSDALDKAIDISKEPVNIIYSKIDDEMQTLKMLLQSNNVSIYSQHGKQYIETLLSTKNIQVSFIDLYILKLPKRVIKNRNDFDVISFYSNIAIKNNRIDRISIDEKSYILGAFIYQKTLIILKNVIPDVIETRLALFNSASKDYNKLQYYKRLLTNNTGVFLFILAIVVILISIVISLYLSKSITNPVLELQGAAKDLAAGNFEIRLHRESKDEMAMLFSSFNKMVEELNKNRAVMYQKQRLEAWREMARRLVHEIKNPLTPIRLSAERIRKRFLENHPDIEDIVLSGTETIQEEIAVLMDILNEFTKFARLPEMKTEKVNINPLLESSVEFFVSHERVEFKLDLDNEIPDQYLDKILIRQAINNILQNAVDALEEQGIIHVNSKFIKDKNSIQVKIQDNGHGIKKEDMVHIFEPGFSRKSNGTGLGLAIVQKIIHEHNGSIICNSKLNEGTEFIIDFKV